MTAILINSLPALRDAAIPICTFLQIAVDRRSQHCYNSAMRLMATLSVLMLLAVPAYPQEPAADTADTVYMPLDSLNAGIDLVLKELKMERGDLTFRGDYLEPDQYRLPVINIYMTEPLRLIKRAQNSLSNKYINVSGFGEGAPDIFGSRNYPNYFEKEIPGLTKVNEIITSRKFQEGLPEKTIFILENVMEFIKKADINNWRGLSEYTSAQLDSLEEGYTLLLEENVEDEFRSVAELDSLEQLEDLWAEKLAVLSKDCITRRWISNDVYKLTYNKEKIDFQSKYRRWETDFGQIIIGDTTDNHYKGDLFIVIDPGGNDTYDIEFEGTGHHTYIIDYGGDDTYNMPKNRISPYFFGSNMIIDYDGDDLYNAGSWTLGAGLFGVGVLWDMKGNDRYYGDTFTMGAGCFGVGILRDDEGNDSYNAALFSQGFGFVDGVGVLIDNAGNDNYFAGGKYKDFIRYDDHYLSLSQGFGYGIRPKMSGGVGMLIDKSGNDVYISDIFGQGASYWYSLGLLADGGGNDQYISFQYAQGNGTHMSLGILYDVEGDDVYSAKGVSQGCGHDYAAGLLIDLDGDDNYNAYDLCQGAGSADGLGLIADVRGKDVYIVRSDKNTQGYGNPRRDYGSIGIFLDLAGEDNYSGGMGRDNHWWTYSTWGAGIDK